VTLSNDGDATPPADDGDEAIELAPGLRARRANVPGVEPQRDLLIVEVLDAMTQWGPRERSDAFKKWLKGSLSLIHLHVLSILEAEGPIPMSRVADTLDVSLASATGIVGRMEERGLVERRHDDEDRRVVLVHPTEKGGAVFHDMIEQRREHLRQVVGRVADDDLKAFLTGLRAIRAAREAAHDEEGGS
jgi:DNA-binding MarR family transcriptional regulator